MSLTPSQMVEALTVLIPQQETVLQTGRPGIGKSQLYAQVAKKLGMKLKLKHPVIEDPTDYKGMPSAFMRDGEMYAEFLPFGDLRDLVTAKEPTLCVFEDMGQAMVATQGALMQLLLAREVNGQKLSKFVHLVGATNRRGDNAGVVGMIEPLKDRFTAILELEFSLSDWLNWAVDSSLPMEVIAFARAKPDIFDPKKYPPSKDMLKSPTPRSVEGLARILPRIEKVSDPVQVEMVQGAIGHAAGMEFLAYLKLWKELPTIDEIVMNPRGAKVPDKLDVLYATMAMIAKHARKEILEECVTYLERVSQPEFMTVCMRDIYKRAPEVMRCAAGSRWAIKNAHLLGADKVEKTAKAPRAKKVVAAGAP